MAWTAPRTWVTGELVTASIMNAHVRDNLKALAAVGDYKYVARPTAGHGVVSVIEGAWAEANGAAISRTTYAAWDAYAAALTPTRPFGAGDGSTTVNVPDVFGRVPIHQGSNTDVDALGESDGESAANRSPKHKTSINDPGHVHAGVHTTNQPVAKGGSGSGDTGDIGSSNSATTGITVGPGGSRPTDTPAFLVGGIWLVKIAT